MEDIAGLQEYSPTDYWFEGSSLRTLLGIGGPEVHFTCIDAVEEFIVIGTNIGVVLWYNRKNKKLNKFRPRKCVYSNTFVKVISSVEYMIAAGDTSGTVNIFVVPKEQLRSPTNRGNLTQPTMGHEYTVSSIHSSPITAIEWSLNGEKLFSGDEKGAVVLTVVDFILNQIKSSKIVKEKSSILQLSYLPSILTITSKNRCIIFNPGLDDKITKVGGEDSSSLRSLGAVIQYRESKKPVIFLARMDQCISLANIDGDILQTYSYRELLAKQHPEIKILDNRVSHEAANRSATEAHSSNSLVTAPKFEFNFLKIFNKRMIAYDSRNLAIFDVTNPKVICGLYSLNKIISLAVNKDEIFVLEHTRRIRRLATEPDKYSQTPKTLPEYKDSQIGEKIIDLVSKIKEEASTSVVKPIIENLTKSSAIGGELDTKEPVVEAEEAITVLNYTEHFFIHDNHFDNSDIVYNPDKKDSAIRKQQLLLTYSNHGDSRIESDVEVAAAGDDQELSKDEKDRSMKEIPYDIQPDLRPHYSIMRDVRAKEQKLAKLLNLESKDDVREIIDKYKSAEETTEDINAIISPEGLLNNSDENLSKNQLYCYEAQKEERAEQIMKEIVLQTDALTRSMAGDGDEKECIEVTKARADKIDGKIDHWRSYQLPDNSKWICATKKGLYYGSTKQSVYYSDFTDSKLRWKKMNFKAFKMAVSPSGSILWKLDLDVAYAYSFELLDRWKLISRHVESISINENSAWYVCNGDVFVQFGLTHEKPFRENPTKIPCPDKMRKICSFGNTVWVLSKNAKIWSKHCARNTEWCDKVWTAVPYPKNVKIADIALGCVGTGWMVTTTNEIFFTDNFLWSKEPHWWQVILNDSMKNDSVLSEKMTRLFYGAKNELGYSVASSDKAIWIANHDTNILYFNQTEIEGHRWVPIYSELKNIIKVKLMCAWETRNEETFMWCLSRNNDLFVLKPLKPRYLTVETLSDEITCMCATPNLVSVLTSDGSTYFRLGIKVDRPHGTIWQRAKFRTNPGLKFKHMTLGHDVIWAVDLEGAAYCAVGIPSDIAKENITSHFNRLEDTPLKDTKFVKIVVGRPDSSMVWALDDENNVFVRQGIFPDYLYGTDWIFVFGIKAVDLVVTQSTVWALTSEGKVYYRFGISPMNYIGDYWSQVPGDFMLITASNNTLWSLTRSDQNLKKYESRVLNLIEEKETPIDPFESTDEEWEVVC